MKLVDILFVLSAAATANAILIPTDNNGSTHTSSTSSQVSGPTNEPNPGTSNEYQEEPMDLSLPNRYRQQLIGLTISNKYKQEPVDESNSNTSGEYQQEPMNSSISSRIQQQPIDQLSPSTSNQDRQNPIDEAGSVTSDQTQRQPIDMVDPSTSSQTQQQPMIHGRSSNTVTNQVTGLSQKYQKTFDRIKKKLVAFKTIRKEKHKRYREYADLKFSQQLRIAMGKEISEPMHNPDDEIRLKQEYEKAGTKIRSIRQELKRFMKRRGLKFEEPDSD
ncbi:hypothetical protein BDEG_22069 [Batrachochytrium dendrobatidis JEL423]|uniref:Uncharacterized protein n=1 Tax=Batrachochytrium dendrobatidis (strain JEL423) TaxID=403673 RepID=A0A177WDD5_BATDL|nr:hypothetical protein BDEG_22069 [Batrachochytrium dendrobatidis JEL423]